MDVKQFYIAVEGNYEEALSRLMNDAFIARMLGKFHDNNSYNDIISSYENKDFPALFSAVHAFKGVAGNLSLTSLFNLTVDITEKTRSLEPVNIDNEINLLKQKYQTFLDSYQKFILR